MALEYKLVPDPTAENPDQHKAVVVNQKEVNLDELVDMVMDRGRVSISKKEVKAIFESYLAALHLAYIDGKTVTTPLIDVTESGLEPGPALRKVAKNIEVRKVDEEDL